jgi:ribosomal protein L15E
MKSDEPVQGVAERRVLERSSRNLKLLGSYHVLARTASTQWFECILDRPAQPVDLAATTTTDVMLGLN